MKTHGFSLVELLVALAVIAILTYLLVPFVSGMSKASQTTVARQQQVELQTALGAWIVAKSTSNGGLAAARASYTGNKKELLRDYLQQSTYEALTSTGENTVVSAALNAVQAYLEFSTWSISGEQPTVSWRNQSP